jgi:chorismate lyase/3-hydroxybenzoate synthase
MIPGAVYNRGYMRPESDASARLRITHGESEGALLHFRFGAAGDDDPFTIPCLRLGGPVEAEKLACRRDQRSADTCGAAWAHGEHYAMVALAVDEDGDIEAATRRAYERLITCVRPSAHPYLLRIWNYFPAINAGDGDGERYRRFCVGRAAGVDGRFNDPPPAATAIGTHEAGGRLQVIALCSRAPAIALENPRQTPAWQYPREYGPVSPGFLARRAARAPTARIRACSPPAPPASSATSRATADDVGAQLLESVANLEALLAEGSAKSQREFRLQDCEALRVYLRDPADLARVQAAVASTALPASAWSTCRATCAGANCRSNSKACSPRPPRR